MTPIPTAESRIHVDRRTARWDDRPVTAADAMDFWSFAGAAANVIMQMAWPEVGHGVVESKVDSGSLMKHPWKRLRTTSQYLAVAILGSDKDRAAFRAAVDVVHREVKSPRKARCRTTRSTGNCRCGLPPVCSSASRTPISCCAGR